MGKYFLLFIFFVGKMLAIPIEGNRWIMTLRLPLPLKSLLLFFLLLLKIAKWRKK